MTAFDTVTATISPAMSTYIRCKGKVWKNAFMSSLQRIAGVEYSVYKKKGSWQIRGEWDNIKQAHKILMKVTATDDWLSFSVPETVPTTNVKPEPSVDPNTVEVVVGAKNTRKNIKTATTPTDNTQTPRCRLGLRQKTDTPIYNEEMLAFGDEMQPKPQSQTEHETCPPVSSPLGLEEIKTEDDEEEEGAKTEPESGTETEALNGNDETVNDPNNEGDVLKNVTDLQSDALTEPSTKESPPVNRRKRGRPRKIQTSMSYTETHEGAKTAAPKPKGDDIDPNQEVDATLLNDLMVIEESDNDNDANDSDTSDKDVTIDSMIKQGKDSIKRLKKFFHCNTCEFKCKSRTSLDEHKQRLHGNRTFKCPICDKVYGVKRDLKKHIRRHTSQFKCEKCNKTYKEQRNYRQHLKTHEDDYIPPQFACEQCDKSFTTKYVLQSHVDQVHNGNVPEWLCNVCGKKFKQKHSLQEHHLIHTGERPFTCKICNKSFRHKGSLVNHELLHTDVRLYTCEVCGKDFKHRNSLRIHAVVHSKFRNFECPVCNKRFTQKQALNRHSRIHSGEKPFMCDLCGDRFNDNSILRRHMMGIHKTELKTGKQHFVLPAEHYTQKREEGEPDQKESETVPETSGDQVKDPNTSKEEHSIPERSTSDGIRPTISLNEYRAGNVTPPTLRAYVAPGTALYHGHGYHPESLPTPPSTGPFPHSHMSISSAAMAAALSSGPMPSTGQYSSPSDNPASNDRPISLTTTNNQYSDLQHNEQNKNTVLPNMQYHRLY